MKHLTQIYGSFVAGMYESTLLGLQGEYCLPDNFKMNLNILKTQVWSYQTDWVFFMHLKQRVA